MSLYGSLFAGVAGLQSQSNALSVISNNIANVNTVGYKGVSSLFQSLVTPNSSQTQFSPGGVVGGNRQLVDQGGQIQGTSSPTDVAISGSGFFVVSTHADGTGTPLYTRAGSFTQDSLGNFINASGLYLEAWPLDRDGRLPGAPGNTEFTTSSADLGSLKVVNLKSISGTASATTTVTQSLNLNAGEDIFPGAAQIFTMDPASTFNHNIAATDIIAPNDYGADSVNSVRRGAATVGGATTDTGDSFTAITTDGQTGLANPAKTFLYGGFTASRSVTGGTVIPVGTTAFATTSGSSTVTVTTSSAHGLGPAGSTTYVDIEGAAATTGFGANKDQAINGVRQVTVIDGTHFSFTASIAGVATNASATSVGFGGASVSLDNSPGDSGTGSNQLATNNSFIQLGNNTFSVAAHSNVVTVTMPGSSLGPVNSIRSVNISGVDISAFAAATQVAQESGPRLITITGTNTFTFNGDATNSTGSPIVFGGDAASVSDFAGNVLDASSAAATFLGVSGTSGFTTAALSFNIAVGGVTHTFTYKSSSPSSDDGEFNNMNNLAIAISTTGDLTARVADGRLYVSATDANQAIVFNNGDAAGDGSASPTPLGGIDWTGELDLHNVAAATGSNRFNTLQGLADLVNATSDMAATVANPSSQSSLAINVKDPRSTITLGNSASNHGSLLSEFGVKDANGNLLMPSLGGTPFDPVADATTGAIGPVYDATNSSKNMASGAITPQFSRNVTIYDSLGGSHELTTAYIKIDTNTWAVEVYDANASEVSESGLLTNGQVATGTIKFNGDGSLASITNGLSGPKTISWTTGTSQSTTTFDWGTAGATGIGKSDGLSQFDADYSLNFINQNGSPVGQLTGVGIDKDGFITATFTNGEVQKLYQIPLADFNSPDGLTSISGNAFAKSNASGDFNLRQAGQNGVGSISPSSLEGSNVELSDQLTQMIVAQRAYEANTKIITTVDSLLEELNNVIH